MGGLHRYILPSLLRRASYIQVYSLDTVIYRPGVTGAVLQSPSLLIHLLDPIGSLDFLGILCLFVC